MLKHIIITAVVLMCAFSVSALPDASTDIWYYDSEGNIVGWWSIACNGARSSGGITTEIYEVFSMPCQTLEPIMCSDIGMNELPGDCGGWCYSDGYVMSYNYDIVPNCEGICLCGEFQPCNRSGPTCGAKNNRSPRSTIMRARKAGWTTSGDGELALRLARLRRAEFQPGTSLFTKAAAPARPIYRFVQPERSCRQKARL